MVVLPSTGASRYHNCCVDGGTSPENFGSTHVYPSNPGPNPVILIQIFVIFSSGSPGKFQGIALN
jgi:hypothetical protein